MAVSDMDVDAARGWADRVKAEIAEIEPMISRVDALWEAGPTNDTLTGAMAEKVAQLDQEWIARLDATWQGIDSVINGLADIWNAIEEGVDKIKGMF